MPTVPSYSNLQTSVSGVQGTSFQGSSFQGTNFSGGGVRAPSGPTPGAIAGEQASAFGRAATSTGDAIGRIAMDMQQQVDETRVIGAVNRAKERMYDLTYNKDTGYSMQKGINALERPDAKGLDLAGEYTQKFQKDIDDIGSSLGNDRQRQAFAKQAGSMRTEMYGGLERHMSQEFVRYQDSEYTGAIRAGQREIEVNYTDVAKGGAVERAVGSIEAATRAKARLAGQSQIFADGEVRKAVSNAHTTAILSALKNDNLTFAGGYLEKFRGQMDGDDILKVEGHVTKGAEQKLSQGAVQMETVKAMPVLAPNFMDKMKQITYSSESNNNPNAIGPYIPGQGTAKGINQVMDATNKKPGYGIKPAQDNSLAERKRVGDEYLEKMLQVYGSPDKAWAAYNAGPGRLDQAIKSAGEGRAGASGWLAYMPDETKTYVTKNMALLAKKGGTVAPRPTEMDFVNGAVANLPPGSSPGAVKATREAAATQFGSITKTLNQKGENALADGQRWAAETGATTLAQLPPAIYDELVRYAPGKLDDLERLVKGRGDVPTDWNIYTNLRALAASQPAKFATTDLRQSYHLLAPAQREQLLDLQTKSKEPNGGAEIATLAQQLGTAHALLGIKGSDAEKKGKFDDAVTQVLAADKKLKGRPLTFEERDVVIKRMMLPTAKESWYSSGRKMYEVAGTPDAATRPPKVSDDDRKLITAALAAERMPVTEDNIQARFKLRYGIK